VQNEGYLGIHLSRYAATLAYTESARTSAKPADCLNISLDEQQIEQGAGFIELANQIAQICSQKQWQLSQVAVALDCSVYMQHEIKSSFTDTKQIANTIHFDTEEAVAADISDIALAFSIKSTNENGSKLRVFTVEKKILAELIKALAANNLDPAIIEPDVCCLSSYVEQALENKNNTLVAALSKSNVYLIGPFGAEQKTPFIQRTFLIGKEQNRNKLLIQHLPMTLAQAGPQQQIEQISLFDSSGLSQAEQLVHNIAVKIEPLELDATDDCEDPVSCAAAAGAVMTISNQKTAVNFRNDYMPYLGRKRRIEKTLKILGISACIILIALGLNLHLKMIKKHQPVKQLHKKLAEDYQVVMLDRKMPSKSSEAMRKLKREHIRIQNLKKGLLGDGSQKSVSAKLTALLAAFNKVAKPTDLNIEKITVTEKKISIKGDTSSQSSTLKLLKEIKKTMYIEAERLGTKNNRNTFSITIGPKK